ncbi:MAG: ParB/RepB/Spo0J family partition protein, partial [Planctomycetota bacterium]
MIDPKTNPAPSTNQPKRELREVLISKTKVPDYARPLSLRNVQRIAKSLSAVGQIQPVLLIPSGDEFLIVSGVHRVHALASINQKSVRAELLPAETSVAQQMVISQQENQVRQNETLTETLDRIDRLVREANCTAKQAAEAAMVSEATLSKINTINDLLC